MQRRSSRISEPELRASSSSPRPQPSSDSLSRCRCAAILDSLPESEPHWFILVKGKGGGVGCDEEGGDGRCIFRALVRGMAANKGMSLTSHEERQDADDLRLAVKEVMCEDERERKQYKEALVAITVEEPLNRYCQRIGRADFWGGESELLVLSKLCKQPINVYIPEREHKNSRGSGFIPIAEYGAEYRKGSGRRKARQVVRLLYSGRNHYDLLV